MGFQQGLSGLNAASKDLDVIGNNIANASTAGFKGSQTQFADVYAASLAGAGSALAGLGVKVGGVAQQFSQGNINATDNPLDVAINGAGFFRMSTNGTVTYTRNGQFQLDKSGFIVNGSGSQLTGYGVDSTTGAIITTDPVPLNLPATDLKPQATGGSAAGSGMKAGLNLDARSTVPLTAFSISDPTSYNNSTSITVYDSLGNPHALSMYFVKSPYSGTWNLHTNIDGAAEYAPAAAATVGTGTTNAATATTATVTAAQAAGMTAAEVAAAVAAATNATTAGAAVTAALPAPTTSQINTAIAAAQAAAQASDALAAATISRFGAGAAAATLTAANSVTTAVATTVVPYNTLSGTQLTFDTSGRLTTIMPMTLSADLDGVAAALGKPNSATTPLDFKFDFTGTSQYGSPFGVNSLTQDGFSSGRLTGFSIGSNGIIQGRYSNGQAKNMGQVVLANFPNTQGLKPLGNNQWAETSESNSPLINAPGAGSLGTLQSAAVEGSNVDLTAELVHMITSQRAYQASAQTIKTQDQVLQTLVNLR